MDDKKFIILLSTFAVIAFALVLGLGAVVLLDSKGHKDPTKKSLSSVGPPSPHTSSLLER